MSPSDSPGQTVRGTKLGASTGGPMPTFHPFHPIGDLRPADYNPRFLEDGAFERLKASLDRWGVIKPVILNGNGTLLAGHQRIKSLQALGWNSVPAVQLSTYANMDAEVLFNLVHNRVETDASKLSVPPGPVRDEWEWIDWEDIQVEERKNAYFCAEIGKMTALHGPWGSAVVNESGHVLINNDYAVVCHDQRLLLLVWRVADADTEQVIADLGGDYGVYEWSKLTVEVSNQHIIQPKRLRKGSTGRTTGSTTWDQFVIPSLSPETRIIDFGAGHMDYATALKKDGYKVWAYEPFFVTRGEVKLDIPSIVKHIFSIEREVKRNGLFDLVVLDSVINGTTSEDYQDWVLATCSALMHENGRMVFGTRRLDYELKQEASEKARTDSTKPPRFLDGTNVEVSYYQGIWVTMRFHTQETLRPILEKFFEEVEFFERRSAANFWGVCTKPKILTESEYLTAFNEEFNMPYPGGFRHGKHDGLVKVLMEKVAERNARMSAG